MYMYFIQQIMQNKRETKTKEEIKGEKKKKKTLILWANKSQAVINHGLQFS